MNTTGAVNPNQQRDQPTTISGQFGEYSVKQVQGVQPSYNRGDIIVVNANSLGNWTLANNHGGSLPPEAKFLLDMEVMGLVHFIPAPDIMTLADMVLTGNISAEDACSLKFISNNSQQ